MLFEIVEAKSLQECERIVIRVVVVPLKSFGVVEEDIPGEGIITVNYIPGKRN